MWLPAQFVPICFLNLNAVVFDRLFDVGESLVAVGIRDTQNLVKAGESVLDMGGVRQRLLPLLRECIYAIGEVTASVSSPCFVCGFQVVLFVIFAVFLCRSGCWEVEAYDLLSWATACPTGSGQASGAGRTRL